MMSTPKTTGKFGPSIHKSRKIKYQSKTLDKRSPKLKLRLCLQEIGYVQIRLGSDPLRYGSTLLTRGRFETGKVLFPVGSLS